MTTYYSASQNGFYNSARHLNIPADAIVITAGEHDALIAAQSQGKQIQADGNGYPVAIVAESSAPTEVEKVQQRIAEIEQELNANGLASLLPLRAKVAGTATPEDEAKLAELDEQAKAFQAELAALSSPKNMR